MLRLKRKNAGIIHVSEMKDGDVAVTGPTWGSHRDRVVQRYENSLIALGYPGGKSWPDAFRRVGGIDSTKHSGCMVRILEPGEELVVG